MLNNKTMEMGSIAKWNLKEGDKFEAGQAICEVERAYICNNLSSN